MSKMQREGVSRLLVTEGGRLDGIVSLKNLLRFLRLKLELEGPDDLGNGTGAAEDEPSENALLHR